MKNFKVLKRHSHQTPPLTNRLSQGGASLWGKRATIFTHSNAELFEGLLALTKTHKSCSSEYQLDDEFDSLSVSVVHEPKNDEQSNPFMKAKMKVMLKKKSGEIETCSSSNAPKESDPFSDLFQLCLPGSQNENEIVTFREVHQKEKTQKRQVLKCLTDRVNRR